MSWQLTFPHATFQAANDRIDLELGKHASCSIRSLHEKLADPTRMGIEFRPCDPSLPIDQAPLSCRDPYVRQDDLIASYPQVEPWPFGYQLDLRVHEHLADSLSGIEVWMSIQTSLLQSAPRIQVVPRDSGTYRMSAGVLTSDNRRAAILIHPLDEPDCTLVMAKDGASVERLEVFGGFMEKGVIRRARLLLVWSDAEVECSRWQQVLQSFSASPLPLTV